MVKFIDKIEGKYRGPVINIILNGIRSFDARCNSSEVIEWVREDLKRRKRYGLPNHLKILEQNLDEEEMHIFINEYIQYQSLPYEQRQRVKQIKVNAKQMQKKLIKDIFNKNHPFSWSALSSWKYSK